MRISEINTINVNDYFIKQSQNITKLIRQIVDEHSFVIKHHIDFDNDKIYIQIYDSSEGDILHEDEIFNVVMNYFYDLEFEDYTGDNTITEKLRKCFAVLNDPFHVK